MAILITGGCGYIGSHTCIELCNAGYNVVALDNFHNAKPGVLKRITQLTGKPVTFYTCDIRDPQGLTAIFENHTIDAVIHFAGWKAVGESAKLPLEYYDNNIGGTVTLLKVMQQFSCKRLVFSSSATVYGDEN
ncbi:MAG: SDR family NAD(P)-dependent oxidoreductase, partial [Clostridia bacterium]|nr:SDR family NAD(P)-dependent oxidoreductase [Clostridia bacterium]